MIKEILILPYCHQLGSTHTLIKIAQILKEKGYKVYVGGEGKYLQLAKDLGFETIKISEIPYDKYREQTDQGKFNYLTQVEIQRMVEEELRIIKKYKIDMIIDTIRPTAYISSRLAKIPRISLNYAILTKHYALGRSIPEGHILDITRLIPPLHYLIGLLSEKVLKMVYRNSAKEYKKVLQLYKMPISKSLDWESLVSDDNTFLYDIPEFAPTKGLPANKRYVGALLLKMPYSTPDWINIVKDKKTDGFFVIYLSMGSTGSFYPKLLESLIEYVKDKKIILIGNYVEHLVNAEKINHDQVFLVNYAPAEAMLDLADLTITHGGRGTVYHSLSYGIPLIGIPHQGEQEWNIRRIKRLKLGEFVSKKRFSKRLLHDKLDKILTHYEEYKQNAISFSRLLKQDYDDMIISLIEELL